MLVASLRKCRQAGTTPTHPGSTILRVAAMATAASAALPPSRRILRQEARRSDAGVNPLSTHPAGQAQAAGMSVDKRANKWKGQNCVWGRGEKEERTGGRRQWPGAGCWRPRRAAQWPAIGGIQSNPWLEGERNTKRKGALQAASGESVVFFFCSTLSFRFVSSYRVSSNVGSSPSLSCFVVERKGKVV